MVYFMLSIQKSQYLLTLVLCLITFADCTASSNNFPEYEYPEQFQVRQDRGLRMFHILNGREFLGLVVSSNYGVLNFYDNCKGKQYLNYEDELFDHSGVFLGLVEVASDKQWFSSSSHIDIFSNEAELLMIFDKESKDHFIFRDPITMMPMATAILSRERTSSQTQRTFLLNDWSVTVIDPVKLQEKKIPFAFLVWTLLKDIQKYLPSPYDECYYLDYFDKTATIDHSSSFSSVQYPDEFQIQQDSASSLFHIRANEKTEGFIVNKSYKGYEFYDLERKRQGIGRYDSLYENSGCCIGFVKVKSESQWFPPKSTLIEIFSNHDQLLATVESEEDKTCFIFRDPVTRDPLAIAHWSCIPYYSWLVPFTGCRKQDWSVTILDALQLQEKEISQSLLIWALIKHSEKNLSFFSKFLNEPALEDIPKT